MQDVNLGLPKTALPASDCKRQAQRSGYRSGYRRHRRFLDFRARNRGLGKT